MCVLDDPLQLATVLTPVTFDEEPMRSLCIEVYLKTSLCCMSFPRSSIFDLFAPDISVPPGGSRHLSRECLGEGFGECDLLSNSFSMGAFSPSALAMLIVVE